MQVVGLAISSSPQNYVQGPVQGYVFFILHAFSSLESEGVSAYAMTRTPLYKVWMSRREDPCGIFNMLFIETDIHFFSFLLSLLIFFSAS